MVGEGIFGKRRRGEEIIGMGMEGIRGGENRRWLEREGRKKMIGRGGDDREGIDQKRERRGEYNII